MIPPPTDPSVQQSARTGFRWVICGILFLATTINYLDRQVIGLLKPVLDAPAHGVILTPAQWQAVHRVEHAVGSPPGPTGPHGGRDPFRSLAALDADALGVADADLPILSQAGIVCHPWHAQAGDPSLETADGQPAGAWIAGGERRRLAERLSAADRPGAGAILARYAQSPAARPGETSSGVRIVLSDAAAAGLPAWLASLPAAASDQERADRAAIGAIPANPRGGIGLSEFAYASIVLVFQCAYALGLLSVGVLIDRYGTRLVYAWSMLFWSAACAAHGLVSTAIGFGAARFALGIGESANFPAANKTVSEWFPRRERAVVVSLFNAGANIGAMTGPWLISLLFLAFGWHLTFIVVGLLGVPWTIAWWCIYRHPTASPQVNAAELSWIMQDQVQAPRTQPVAWLTLVRQPQTWAVAALKFFTDGIWWFYLFWLPDWLWKTRGLDLTHAWMPLFAIYLTSVLGSFALAGISSRMLAAGASVNAARKTGLLVSALLVLPIAGLSGVHALWPAVAIIGLACAAHQGYSATVFSCVADLFPQRAVASVTGFAGMVGAIGGMLFTSMVGQVLAAHPSGYGILFLTCAVAYLAGLGLMQLLAPRMLPADDQRLDARAAG